MRARMEEKRARLLALSRELGIGEAEVEQVLHRSRVRTVEGLAARKGKAAKKVKERVVLRDERLDEGIMSKVETGGSDMVVMGEKRA